MDGLYENRVGPYVKIVSFVFNVFEEKMIFDCIRRQKDGEERRGERRKNRGRRRKLLHIALVNGKLLDFVFFL